MWIQFRRAKEKKTTVCQFRLRFFLFSASKPCNQFIFWHVEQVKTVSVQQFTKNLTWCLFADHCGPLTVSADYKQETQLMDIYLKKEKKKGCGVHFTDVFMKFCMTARCEMTFLS